jgi:hypothetical protein
MSIATPVLLPLAPKFSTSAFLIYSSKIFVRSRRDWETKCRIGIRHFLNFWKHFYMQTVVDYIIFKEEYFLHEQFSDLHCIFYDENILQTILSFEINDRKSL